MIYSVGSSTVTAFGKGFPKAIWGGISFTYSFNDYLLNAYYV